jgi:hypothetical protein
MKHVGLNESKRVPRFQTLNEQLPFVFLPAYAAFVNRQPSQSWLLFTSDDGRILLPARCYKSSFLQLIQPLHAPLCDGKRLEPIAEESFLEAWIAYLDEQKIGDRITQPPTHAVFAASPVNSRACEFGTYFLSLAHRSEFELWEGIHGKHRNVIRNAEKKGVEIRFGLAQLPFFYELYEQTMSRAGMFCEPYSSFVSMAECLGEDHLLCAVAFSEGKAQGAVLLPFTDYCAYYVYGASAKEISVNGAITYLHWVVICKMKKQGVRRYDFVGARLSNVEGSKLAGIQQFKERFGANLESGVLWKKDLSKIKCTFYDILLKVKFLIKNIKLKGDIIDQELMKQSL